jgi:hypothetical protein
VARNMLSEAELDHLLRRTSRTRPVDRDALDDAGVQAALASLRHDIESGAHHERPSRLGMRPVFRRRWVTLGAATAAVAVVSLIGVETLTGGGGGGLPLAVPPAAAAQLNGVARAAAAQPTPAAGQSEYLTVKVEGIATMQAGNPTDQGTNPAGYPTVAYTDTQTVQNWVAPDGDTTRQRTTGDSFSFLTPQDQATYLAHKAAFDAAPDQLGHMMVIGITEDKTSPASGGSQPVWETSPPTDPQTLINELWSQFVSANKQSLPTGLTRRQAAGAAASLAAQRPSILWTDLSDLLLNSTSEQLRSTAYAALTYVTDTKVVGNETDQLGRSGIGISWTGHGPGYDETLIVSPSTGDLLEEDDTLTKAADGLPAGTVARREIFLQRAIVNSNTALPDGGTQPLTSASQTTTTTAAQTTTAPQTTTTAAQTPTTAPPTTTTAAQATTTATDTTATATETATQG